MRAHLPSTNLLGVADPVEPPGGHVSSEAVGRLSREHGQRAPLRRVHPRLLQGHPLTVAGTDPEHQAARQRGGKLNKLIITSLGSSTIDGFSI